MSSSSKAIAACALIIVACIGLLSFRSEVRSEEDRAWVRHTYLVVERLQAVRIDITEAETGQRAFMLTGEQTHLEQFDDGVSQLGQDMRELSDLSTDNAEQREAIVNAQCPAGCH